VFVGKVAEVYPAESMQEYGQLLLGESLPGEQTPDLDRLKSSLLSMWARELSETEARRIKQASSARELQTPLDGLFWSMPRKVTLDVTERFQGAKSDHFELFTGIGGGDCGVGFRKGGLYLVVARQEPKTGRWTSTICSRTSPVEYADVDLRALRARKRGEQIAPMAYGTVQDWTNRGHGWGVNSKPLVGLRLTLRSGDETRAALSDQGGNFQFENLEHKVYRLSADLPGWRFLKISERERDVDLTRSGCSQLFLTMEQLQGEIRGRVLSDKESLKEVLWIEAIPADPKSGLASQAGGTKPDGSFVIDSLEPGDYVIAIDVEHAPTTPNGRSSKYERITPFIPSYYPGVTDRAQAQVFHFERDQTIQLPPWTLPPPSGERAIKGVVVWPDGRREPAAAVALIVASTNVPAMRLNKIESDGSFTVFGLRDLGYRVAAAAYKADEKMYYRGSADALPDCGELVVVLKPDGPEPSDKGMFPGLLLRH